MQIPVEGQSPRDRAIERIAQEIAIAERDRVPTSRQKLSQLVTLNLAIAPAEASKIVDEYCDEKAPGVPQYLQAEFESPFLKVMAIVNSILGMASLWYGAHLWRLQKVSWHWFVLGAIFVGAAGYSWFKTIQQEIAKG